MANGSTGGRRAPHSVKRRTRVSLMWRLLSRIGAVTLALLIFTLAAIQFIRVAHQNLALKHELASTQSDIAQLEAHREWQLRQLRRLRDPQGAVPEIHDRLRLVRPNEAIVFVSPLPSPQSTP